MYCQLQVFSIMVIAYRGLGQLGTSDLIVGGAKDGLMKMRAASGSRLNADKIAENVWVGGVNSPAVYDAHEA